VVNHVAIASDLDGLFGALASPARRAILRRLAPGPAPVHVLAEPLTMSAPAASKHLRVLEEAGLVARRRHGRVHEIHLRRRVLGTTAAWLAGFWDDALDTPAARLSAESAWPPDETGGEA
jgi:DNA-binding transcriptional ArsR family regulator